MNTINLIPAFENFLMTLAAAKRKNETIFRMENLVKTMQLRLDGQWETLEKLAVAGMDQSVSKLLDGLIREWASMQALILICDREEWIDPDEKGVRNAFWEKLTQQHAWLQSQLLLLFKKGASERKEIEEKAALSGLNLVETRIQGSEKYNELLAAREQKMTDRAFKLLDQREEYLEDIPKQVLAALTLAQKATEQQTTAAQGHTAQALNLFAGVQRVVDNTQECVEETDRYIKSQKPFAKAMRRVEWMMWASLVIGSILALILFGITHLY